MLEAYTIRAAQASDLEDMVRLLSQLFALERDFDIDPKRQRAGLEQLLASDIAQIFVASLQDRVVAMVTVQRVISTAEGGPVAWVEDLVVDASCRGQGIGRSLLGHLQDWCAASNISRLQLVADRDNHAALDFYRRQGWLEMNLNVLRHVQS
ncbi:MAG: GNAT family N-acetyltransferase [Candidatus Thiodiazotropha sp.]